MKINTGDIGYENGLQIWLTGESKIFWEKISLSPEVVGVSFL